MASSDTHKTVVNLLFFLRRAHTVTVLLMMLCVLVYVGAFEYTHESNEYNAKRLVRMLQCCSKGEKLGEGGKTGGRGKNWGKGENLGEGEGEHRIECQRHGLLGRSGNFEF